MKSVSIWKHSCLQSKCIDMFSDTLSSKQRNCKPQMPCLSFQHSSMSYKLKEHTFHLQQSVTSITEICHVIYSYCNVQEDLLSAAASQLYTFIHFINVLYSLFTWCSRRSNSKCHKICWQTWNVSWRKESAAENVMTCWAVCIFVCHRRPYVKW